MTPGYFADDAIGFFDGYCDEEPSSSAERCRGINLVFSGRNGGIQPL
jgi:hypothetical protein